MMYRKYLRKLETNFTVYDGVKCEQIFNYLIAGNIFMMIFVFPFVSMIFIVLAGLFFTDDPSNELWVSILSFSFSIIITGDICRKNKKKWKILLDQYKEMQHERCLDLGLPLVFKKGTRISVTGGASSYHYVCFLMPAEFEEEFFRFRKNDRCRRLIFDYKLEKNWLRTHMRECFIDTVKYSEKENYSFKGMKPIFFLP